jgi:hypothetical protein
MIFKKISSPKNSAKKLAFLTQNKAKFWKNDHNIGFWEKRQFFHRKLGKIAENYNHNIDPRSGCWGNFFLVQKRIKTVPKWPQNVPLNRVLKHFCSHWWWSGWPDCVNSRLLFTLGSYFENYRSSQNVWVTFSTTVVKKWSGYILGDFCSNSSGHTDDDDNADSGELWRTRWRSVRCPSSASSSSPKSAAGKATQSSRSVP